jgi:hypothetical protein
MGAVSEPQVASALAAQQGCPLFPLPGPQTLPAKMYWPEFLMDRYGAVPVFHNHNTAEPGLYVGFLQRVEHRFLLALERMLGCHTHPCIVPRPVYERQRELRAFALEGETIMIHQPQNGVEMTRTIGNYAEQVRAERCSVVGCDDRLWTRLEIAGGRYVDFLFGLPTSR